MATVLLSFCLMSLIFFSVIVAKEVIQDLKHQLHVKQSFSGIDSSSESIQ